MMNELLLWLSAFLLLTGSLVTLIAALGVLRLPDFFMRMHAATKAGVVGPSLILLAAGFYEPSFSTWVKILFAILFLLTTTPISGHLIGKAGFVGGVTLWRKTVRNELETVLPTHGFVELDVPEEEASAHADHDAVLPPSAQEAGLTDMMTRPTKARREL